MEKLSTSICPMADGELEIKVLVDIFKVSHSCVSRTPIHFKVKQVLIFTLEDKFPL